MAHAEGIATSTRRVRPWIAALLTLFLGWGTGFYYARRTKAAILWAVAQAIITVLAGAGLIAYMISSGTAPQWLLNPDGAPATNVIGLALGAVVAIFAWVAAARHREVKRSGPVRLLGYLAIWLAPILVALIFALSIRFFYVHPFRIPSGSMQPTLQIGDYILVSKRSYGYGPFSTAPLVGVFEHRTSEHLPQRGDIVVFRPSHQPDRDFVSRIVGMPGDRVQMRGGVLRINRTAVEMHAVDAVQLPNFDGVLESVPAFSETLPGGVTHAILDRNPSGELDHTREVTVPEGHYFVMGDDRDFSDDSRRSVGFVPLDNIIGKVEHILQGPHGS